MNMKKTARILSLIAVLALALTLVVTLGVSASAEDTSTTVTDAASFLEALGKGGTIVLANDIYLGDAYITDGAWVPTTTTVSTTVTITSASGGPYTIYRGIPFAEGAAAVTVSASTPALTLSSDAHVTLTNVILDGQKSVIADQVTTGGMINVVSGATLVLEDGAIIQNTNAKQGGGVYTKGTIVIKSGSVIRDNAVNSRGGGLAIYGGKTYMMGGAITGNDNTSTYAGGVQIMSASFYLYGGSISNNTISNTSTSTMHGVGINVSDNGNFYFVGGTVAGNVAAGGNGRAVSLYNAKSRMYFGTPEGVTLPTEAGTPTGEPILLYQNANQQLGNAGTATSEQISFVSKLAQGSRIYLTLKGSPVITCTDEAEDVFAGAVFSYADRTTLFHTAGTPVFENRFKVGETVYTSLDEAAVAAANGTVLLTHDIIASGTALPTGTYTLDGAGKSILRIAANSPMLKLPEGADVTLTNVTLDGIDMACTGSGGALFVNAGASLTLDGGTEIFGFEATYGSAIYSKGTVTVKDCTISENIATKGGAGVYAAADSTLYVTDGAKITRNMLVAGGAYGGGVHNLGLFVMTGGEIVRNVALDPTLASECRAAGVYSTDGAFWMTGGKINENLTFGQYGGGVTIAKGDFYMLGGEIRANRMVKFKSSGTYHGMGIAFTSAAHEGYLLGGTVEGNKMVGVDKEDPVAGVNGRPSVEFVNNQGIVTVYADNTQYQYVVYSTSQTTTAGEIRLYKGSSSTNISHVYIGGAITLADAPVENGVNGVTVDGDTITTSNALRIPAALKTATFTFNGTTPAQLILAGALAKGSEVVLPDNHSSGYIMTVADGYEPTAAELGKLYLAGADALYRPTVEEGQLSWSDKAYQVYQSAVLDEAVGFRITFARRSAADETVLDGVTVEQFARVFDENSGSWRDHTPTPEWTPQTYQGSPCIMIPLAPKQATDQITVKKDGVSVKTEGETYYTFASYLKQMWSDDAYAAYKDLVGATLNYCAAAQSYFKYNCENVQDLANDGVSGLVAAGAVDAKYDKDLSEVDAVFYGAQVDLASTVSVAIIVQSKSNATFKIGAAEASAVAAENYRDVKDVGYAIVIPDLTAAQLLSDITVEIDGKTLTYSVPAYAYRMQEKLKESTEQENIHLVALVQALCAYAEQAAVAPAN